MPLSAAERDLLITRAGGCCELCGATTELAAFAVAPRPGDTADESILACRACRDGLNGVAEPDHRWRCLTESAWSQVPAVQVVAWRTLEGLSSEDWARDLLEQLYLDEETMAWVHAKAEAEAGADEGSQHKDTFGAVLNAGDTVTLIKDLKVKGANFTAKRGTAVRNIALVPDNPEQIEGRVNDQRIVILTEFVKKSS
ncbi:PhnA domain-containing protein [Pannonibacter sp. SL95]|uniref:PhnA domain-containing protein n=1 Tax=Pannonibacter sp. SL95 TaxID=2995153 RepID=UPI0022731232|nr:alkylphosphonate utilization protein [Pannonibacter sp. SL95]MCY1705655.1 PhnA domain-containing protein [Pannonibacter sp. SL95]